LFRSIEVYFNFLIEASKGSAYTGVNNDVTQRIKDLEQTLLANIRAVEIKLSEMEAK
jgi:predicted GIY-YIG superfamily endonuclease